MFLPQILQSLLSDKGIGGGVTVSWVWGARTGMETAEGRGQLPPDRS